MDSQAVPRQDPRDRLVKSLPEPGDSNLAVEEVLMLRLRRLERERHELYFLQQDAQATPDGSLTDQTHQASIDLNRRAQGLIALALQQMRSFARDS